ncbi:ankyrin repeat domain-containing protein [Hyalangium minutum]|uniref:Ankyrin repeat protein n=1 Tax=Hyalangium minutum TaxID=394096 RepID=A0A085W478_9BACT|nr:ankyrin repeat domain-containing protein [Hyalangium minutum]KFE62491.1 Ankyrin repeat protein [Hyalangium minutum]
MKTMTQDWQTLATNEDAQALTRVAFEHARAGNTGRLAWLLAAGLPVNLSNERGDTLLMVASYHGHLQTTRILLENEADPDRANCHGRMALAGAAFKGDLAIARLLLDHGARVDGTARDGRTALMYAAMCDQLELLELLVARGSEPALQDATGCTALEHARSTGARRAVEWLEQFPQAHSPLLAV